MAVVEPSNGDAGNVLNNRDDKIDDEDVVSLTRTVVYADEAPSAQLHLVYLKAARRCYETGRYAEGTEICSRIVNTTPEVYALLAKCSIEVIYTLLKYYNIL